MLERAGPDAAKPEDLGEQYGLKDDGQYFLSPEQAQAVHAFIRGKLAVSDGEIAQRVRILYGGSMNAGVHRSRYFWILHVRSNLAS